MNKFLLIVLFIVFSFVTVDAAIYKGQKVFRKKCLHCHSSAQAFIASHTADEWKKLMGKDGSALAKLHLKTSKAKRSWQYFKSQKYTKSTKHLQQFLVEYAKDSGNVPACN